MLRFTGKRLVPLDRRKAMVLDLEISLFDRRSAPLLDGNGISGAEVEAGEGGSDRGGPGGGMVGNSLSIEPMRSS